MSEKHPETRAEQTSHKGRGASRPSRRAVLQGIGVLSAIGFFGSQSTRAQESGQADSQCRVAADRHIVGTDSQAAVASAHARADSVNRVLSFGSRGRAVVGRFSPQARNALEQRSDVRYVEEDGIYEAVNQTLPWGVDRIDADVTNANGFTGSGADIAILDTGIDENHPDLAPNLGTGKSFVNYTSSWDDDQRHGTHCAGIAAAVDNTIGVVGVAPAATLHAGKVLNNQAFGYWSWIAAGIVWAADQGYDVANMSFGGSYSFLIADACAYAYNKGVLLAAAAGNDSRGSVLYPAALSTVIAVSSTTKNDTLSSFSNVGTEIELAAPGSNIYSTVPGSYGTLSGTSMACPHVCGVGGLLMSLDGGGLSNSQARQRLHETAEDIGLSENEQGFGLVDAEAAVMGASIGEVGRLSTSQPDRETWQTVYFEGSYHNPVVIMKPLSNNGTQSCHTRIRNVTGESFAYKLEEWAYEDGGHTTEDVSYLVLEAGTHTFSDGTYLEVGQIGNVTQNFTSTNFSQTFELQPVVFAQAQTENGSDPIVTRMESVTTDQFRVRVQEEEANGSHVGEQIGYVAIEPGQGDSDSRKIFEAERISDVTNNWQSIELTREYGTDPIFLADMQTFNGGDPAELRYRNLQTQRVEVRVEEEQSLDSETNHAGEEVGYLTIRGTGRL